MTRRRTGNSTCMVLILIGWLLIAVGQVRAGSITLATSLTSESDHQGIRVMVETGNQGLETAYGVNPEVCCLGSCRTAQTSMLIKPGASYRFVFFFPVTTQCPGLYPVLAIVDFTDENGRPFSAVAYGEAVVGERTESNVAVSVKPVKINERAEVVFKAVNWDGDIHGVRAGLTTPREFKTGGVKMIDLPPLSETLLTFELINESALPGAEYPSVLNLEYEYKGRKMLAKCELLISTDPDEPFFKLHRRYFYFSGLTVLGLALILQFLLIKAFPPRRRTTPGAPG